MAEPKRRYKSDLGLQAAQRSLDQIINSGFETIMRKQELESAKEERFLSAALQSELASQAEYTKILLDEGVKLPDKFRTSGYSNIVENATGDFGSVDMLNTALENAKTNSSQIQGIYSDFMAGKKLSQSGELSEFSNLIPSEAGTVGTVQFSGQEFDQIFAMKDDEGNLIYEDRLEGKDLDIFKQGFLAGNMDQVSALKYMETENNLYNSKLNTANGQFAMAEALGVKALNNVENDMLSLIDSRVPVSTLIMYGKNIDNEDSNEAFVDGIQELIKGESVGLSKDGFVAKLLASTIRSATLENAKSPTYSFSKLAANANEELNKYNALLGRGDSRAKTDFGPVMEDFKKLGLIQGKEGQYSLSPAAVQAVNSLDNMDDLFEQMGQYSQDLSEQMAKRGMIPEDSLQFTVGETTDYGAGNNSQDLDNYLLNFTNQSNINTNLETSLSDKNITDNELLNSLDNITKRKGELADYYAGENKTSYEQALDFYFGTRSISDVIAGTNFSEKEFEYLTTRPDAALMGWAANQGIFKAGVTPIKKDAWKDDTTWTAEDYQKALYAWKEANRQATPKGIWADIVRMSLN